MVHQGTYPESLPVSWSSRAAAVTHIFTKAFEKTSYSEHHTYTHHQILCIETIYEGHHCHCGHPR